jgi:hypothetical protein
MFRTLQENLNATKAAITQLEEKMKDQVGLMGTKLKEGEEAGLVIKVITLYLNCVKCFFLASK